MRKLLVILFTFAIFTIWHHEVHVTLPPDDAMRSSNLKRTEINEELVSWGSNGLFLYRTPAHRHNDAWYSFIPWDQIVVVERKETRQAFPLRY